MNINFSLEKDLRKHFQDLKLGESLIVKNKPLEDFYKCKLCDNILIEPIACQECEAIMCTGCLKSKLNEVDKCVICEGNPFKEAKNNKQLSYILNQIILKCPFDCNQTVEYENLLRHLEICETAPKFFSCELCGNSVKVDKVNKEALAKHQKECPSIIMKCIHCNNEYEKKNLQIHMKNCEYKLYLCPICKIKYPGKFRLAHNDYYCRQITEIHKIFDIILDSINICFK